MFTPRQTQILIGLVAGKSRKQLAAELNISPGTIACHVEAAMRRCGAASSAHLVAIFLRTIENPT